MQKFLVKSILMFFAILLGYLITSLIVNTKKNIVNNYMQAIIDKHDRISEIKSPKLILAGGSNLAFGINSQKLQDEFNVPVVNLGLHAGLGLEFILNELKKSINDSDVVIISPEYFLGNGLYELKNFTQSLYPNASNYYDKNLKQDFQDHIKKTRKAIKTIGQDKGVNTSFSVYTRNGFNKFGDVISHIDQVPKKELSDRGIINYRYWKGIEILNDFYKYAQTKNVNVFFTFPNFPQSEYNKNDKCIEKLNNDILKNLKIEVLNSPKDMVLNDSLFYDTIYHLNGKGRELRTEKLIDSIKNSSKAKESLYAIKISKINLAF